MNVHIWQLLPKRFHIQMLHRSKTKHIFVAATEQLKLFFLYFTTSMKTPGQMDSETRICTLALLITVNQREH